MSNGASNTLYFANNNDDFFKFDADEQYLPVCRAATREGHKVLDLHSFTSLMLPKCTLGRLISRYMVLVQSTRQMMVMRPYQIYAVESILQCVDNDSGNGYIWHTTGSGKTLTSFKASTLLKGNGDIAKCIFVVDRKDLDTQTREEFNKFQEGCVEQNINTGALVNRLCSEDYADKVIVTTGGHPSPSGFDMLKGLDLEIVPPVPSLFSLCISDKSLTALMGTVVEQPQVSLAGTKIKTSGPLLITHWGISGPAVLKLSSHGARILAEKNYQADVTINWLFEMSNNEVQEMLSAYVRKHSAKKITSAYPPVLNARLWAHSGAEGEAIG